MSAVTLYVVPATISASQQGHAYVEATHTLRQIESEGERKQTQLDTIRRDATMTVLKESVDPLKTVLTFVGGVLTFLVSMKVLSR